MTEPTTRAGKALLRSDFDTTGWGPRVVRGHVTKAVLAIEAEAREQERERLLPLIEAVRAFTDAPSKGPTAIREQTVRRIALSEALVALWDRAALAKWEASKPNKAVAYTNVTQDDWVMADAQETKKEDVR